MFNINFAAPCSLLSGVAFRYVYYNIYLFI